MPNLNVYHRFSLPASLSLVFLVWLGGCASVPEQPDADPTVIYLVRHAEKLSTGTNDPSLSASGEIRAQALAQMLAKESIDALFSSDYQRTRLTLQPLAKQQRLPITIYDASDSVALVNSIVSSYKGKTIVVAGHSNTIPELVALLSRPDILQNTTPVSVTNLGHDEYNRLFAVIRYSGRIPTVLELAYPQLPMPDHSH